MPAPERFDKKRPQLVAVLGSSRWRHYGPHENATAFPRLSFSSDGKRVLLSSYVRDTIRVTDAETGEEVTTFRRPRPLAIAGGEGWVGASFSEDGRLVALMSGTAEDWSWTVWEVATRKVRVTVRGIHHPWPHLYFSPGGKFVVAPSDKWLLI